MAEGILKKAQGVLEQNTKGDFIMPDAGYYEGVWLWDTGFIELGEVSFRPEKAAERLLNWLAQVQWKNGFLPHILFFTQKPKHYFPGPLYWQTDRSQDSPAVYTSGITQPPVLGFCALRIYEVLKNLKPKKADWFLAHAYRRLLKYHRWLFKERDPEGGGLVSIYHPWESGFDNSPRWEELLSRLPLSEFQVQEIKDLRKDIKGLVEELKDKGVPSKEAGELAAEMRPSDEDYSRYLYLMRFCAERNYQDREIYPEIPFNVKDVLFNSVLFVSNEALIFMALLLRNKTKIEAEKEQKTGEIEELRGYLRKQKRGLAALYDPESGLYYDLDTKTGKLIKRKTIASFAPLFTGIPTSQQAERMVQIAEGREFRGSSSRFLIPSTARSDPSFHPTAYWRGPIWFPANWLVLRGFERTQQSGEGQKMAHALLDLVSQHGFYEYYHPDTYEGLGRENFSWTASLAIELKEESNFWQNLWQAE